jgi:hypothetical protein
VAESGVNEKLLSLFHAADRTAMAYLEKERYPEIYGIYQGQLELLFYLQRVRRLRLHKGVQFHNMGLALLLQGRSEGAHLVAMAYFEDLLTYGEGRGDPEKAPACRLLTELQYSAAILAEIRRRTQSALESKKLPRDPRVILEDLVKIPEDLKLEQPNPKEFRDFLKAFFPRPDPKPTDTLLVFVGGSFKTIVILRHFRDFIDKKPGYEVVLLDVPVPRYLEPMMYSLCTGAMDDCDYSVFEVTIHEWQIAEITHHYERWVNDRRHLGMKPNILLLSQQTFDFKQHVPLMLPPEYKPLCESYKNLAVAESIIDRYLP